jgi:uncharacterized protein (TIGR03790 family)
MGAKQSYTACALWLLIAAGAQGQGALNERVLVVYNPSLAESKEVAFYYLGKRAIPRSNTCEIRTSSTDQIKQDEYDSSVKAPIRKCLERVGKDKILYVVFSYKTPWLLEMGPQTYALDQFVADVWDEYLPERPANPGEAQPYYGIAQSEGELFQPYTPLADYRRQANARTIYSVWRLDAATPALAKGLVDKALFAEANGLSGNACFDRRTDPLTSVPDFGYGAGDWEIHAAADLARRAGFTVIEDGHAEEFGTAPAPLRCDHAALYAGWYSLNHYNDAFTWNPGAIGIHLDSASATNPRGGSNWAANALAHGITITSGAMTEPYLDNLPHPDQALWCLFHGANVGDALLRSERLLKWRIVNMGDPLYRPFPNGSGLKAQVEPELVLAMMPKMTLGDTTSAAAIGMSEPAPAGGLSFSVKTDKPDLVSVPANVTLREGTEVVKFPISTLHVSSDSTTVRLSVAAKGLQRSNTLVVFSLLVMGISPENVKGGSAARGTVMLRRALQAGATVALKSNNPGVASVPAELEIPAGQGQASFPITTHGVGSKTAISVSASYAGVVRSAELTVMP